jgi:very-short-patch-repair endonuclease
MFVNGHSQTNSNGDGTDRTQTFVNGDSQTNPVVPRSVWSLEAVRGTGDLEVARIADRQRGLIHRRQLEAAGLGQTAIRNRVRKRQLQRVLPDVFAVGSGLPTGRMAHRLGVQTAAVMQFNGRGLLSRRSAGVLWGLIEPVDGPVTLTVVGWDGGCRWGLTVHRVKFIDPSEIRTRLWLPLTSPARTLLDLAGVLDPFELESALANAVRGRLLRDSDLRQTLSRAPRSTKGIATLRALLQGARPAADTRSIYERRLLRLIEQAELPRPLTNIKVAGHMVDMLWPEQRLIVEFDGWEFHHDRGAFERDRLRDQRLIAAGHRVTRVTARHVDRTPFALVARLAAGLSHTH